MVAQPLGYCLGCHILYWRAWKLGLEPRHWEMGCGSYPLYQRLTLTVRFHLEYGLAASGETSAVLRNAEKEIHSDVTHTDVPRRPWHLAAPATGSRKCTRCCLLLSQAPRPSGGRRGFTELTDANHSQRM